MSRILIILILAAFGFQSEKTRIVFFGDSLTAGYGLDKNYAYPAVVNRILEEKGYDAEVVNAGLSGETTAGGLSRVNWILKKPADIFILELGANDGLRGLPLSQTRQNLQDIIDEVRARNPDTEIIIAGMLVPPNMGPDYSKEFQTIFPELARKNNIHFIPFLLKDVAGHNELNQGDGIHPNAEGHKIVAENVMEVLEPLLR